MKQANAATTAARELVDLRSQRVRGTAILGAVNTWRWEQTRRSVMRVLLVLLVVSGVVLTASGCGRKATPDFPPDSDYPRRYPVR